MREGNTYRECGKREGNTYKESNYGHRTCQPHPSTSNPPISFLRNPTTTTTIINVKRLSVYSRSCGVLSISRLQKEPCVANRPADSFDPQTLYERSKSLSAEREKETYTKEHGCYTSKEAKERWLQNLPAIFTYHKPTQYTLMNSREQRAWLSFEVCERHGGFWVPSPATPGPSKPPWPPHRSPPVPL